MSTDYTPIGNCAICGGRVITDEPSAGCDEAGHLADEADTGLIAHSGCIRPRKGGTGILADRT